jgi:hypothetical protein
MPVRHRRLLLSFLTVLMISGGTARAGWCEFWYRAKLDYQRVNAWPEPFRSDDRQLVPAPFIIMKDKGWQLENTITDFHFDAETQQLTRAGELKLHNILNTAPLHRRTVFVLNGHNPQATAVRVGSVQNSLSRMIFDGPPPAVVQTHVAPRGWPAEYVDDITRKAQSSRPAPILPASAAGSGGGQAPPQSP